MLRKFLYAPKDAEGYLLEAIAITDYLEVFVKIIDEIELDALPYLLYKQFF